MHVVTNITNSKNSVSAGKWRWAHLVRLLRRAAVTHIAEKIHAVYDRQVSGPTVNHSLLCSDYSKFPHWPLSTVKSNYNEYEDWTMKQWKKEEWSDESLFFLHHVQDNQIYVHCFWYSEYGIHVDVPLTCTTYLNITADQVHPVIKTIYCNGRTVNIAHYLLTKCFVWIQLKLLLKWYTRGFIL